MISTLKKNKDGWGRSQRTVGEKWLRKQSEDQGETTAVRKNFLEDVVAAVEADPLGSEGRGGRGETVESAFGKESDNSRAMFLPEKGRQTGSN